MPSVNRALLGALRAAMGAVAVLLLVAGFRASWDSAQHVVLAKGREHGTLTVADCGEDTCTGPYAPKAPAPARTGLTIEKSIAVEKGAVLKVVLKPGTKELVRTGPAGALHAWLPFAGALLLASIVIAGGLALPRVAAATAATGAAIAVATFTLL
ncbi:MULTISPECIES: hypothetical protein [Streptomyces]|uniref:Uncharacterized protein n=1 Tax=Streptomyces tsukubensis (strain DSM 42081 / NBRC 108919 / NRRL 18488 / 9993) TaxID=1114943 RepID=I2MZP2_STRT9|nr:MULTISPECIES: hypothetical protein [Streptomyces]AZK94483.1 hypothetical protein B7R87_11900 [Streptomyces tsukubensis]EIF90239.1 hypothetical protein [Streptomyces tsukubensis NRRL18488]MYS68171.1 hypothetical protein [Streptomyces sp. SID5473]QKM69426.1 hypothetical protein STSU_021875 [Streptomyces tsukubensis NRRL18488]TAI42644.1 hypothetical protein EWI31_19655 [Streptomyces tsukubensis]